MKKTTTMTCARRSRGCALIASLLLIAGGAESATQWWDAAAAAGVQSGPGVWSTGSAFWATNSNPVLNDGPYAWVNNNDAVFSVATTSTVNGVTANSTTLSAAGIILNPGAGVLTNGAGGMSFTLAGSELLGCDVVLAAPQTWTMTAAVTATITGRVSGAALTLKPGTGTFALTNANNSFSGLTIANGGTLVAQAGASVLGTGPVNIGPATGSLLSNPTLTINGQGTTTTQIGDLTIGSPGTLILNSTASTNYLNAGNLTRVGRATLAFNPASQTFTREIVTFSGGVTLVNGFLPPWMINLPNKSFLTYSGAITNAPTTMAAFSSSSAAQWVSLQNATNLSTDAAAYLLKDALGINLNGNSLRIGNGTNAALMLTGGTFTNSSANGALDFQGAEALIVTPAGTDTGLIGVPITNTVGLTKFGNGTLTISNAALCAGDIALESGTLVLKPTTDILFTNNIIGIGNLTKDMPTRLTLTGTTIVNTAVLNVSGTSLVLSNGAQFLASSGLQNIGNAMSNVAMIVTGTNTLWDNGALNGSYGIAVGAGAGALNDSLVVANSATVTNTYALSVSELAGNAITISNGANVTIRDTGNNSGLYCGSGAGDTSNQLYIGSGAILRSSGANIRFRIGCGAAISATGNVMTIDGGTMLNTQCGSLPGVGGAYNVTGTSVGNALIITNGGTLTTGYGFLVGANTLAISNRVALTGTNSSWTLTGNDNSKQLAIGVGSSLGNELRVDQGALFTCSGANAWYVGMNAGALRNALIVTNGSRMVVTGNAGWSTATIGSAANSNALLIASGPLGPSFVNLGANALIIGAGAATGNLVRVDGSVLSNITTLTLGTTNTSGNNSCTIANGGAIYATTLLNGGSTGGAWSPNNTVTLTANGLLEASTISNGVAVGNAIYNNGGVYQFTSLTPLIAPNGNPITINGGSISYRNLATVDVRGNLGGNGLTNLTWSGDNGFRLTFASNTTSSSQNYVFEPGITPTNYARLEMVNGSTCYRGQITNSLTIGAGPGSSASMLCSNTAAVVAIPFTNNGTLRIVNSTLTFTTNAVINGTVIVDLNRLANTGTVLIAQKDLTLGGTLQFVGTPTTNLTLMTFSGTRSGKFQIAGLPATYSVSYSATQNGVVSLKQTPPGTVLIVF